MENNKVKITGKIMETPEYVLTASDGRKIYRTKMEVMRNQWKYRYDTDSGAGKSGMGDFELHRRKDYNLRRIQIIQ